MLGAGTIGLMAALILRLKGIEVTAFGRTPAPYLNSDLLDAIGARYVSTQDVSLSDAVPLYGPFDLIYEATGFAPIVFEAMQALGKNGVLVLASVTGGNQTVEVPAARINLEFVLGNKVMVGHRERQPRVLRSRDSRSGDGAGAVSRLGRAPADAPSAGTGELPAADRHVDQRP